ncbi:MAG TPA: sulfotransferase [Rhizomicrobium sp.]|jgi:tetratricopeptide (TPR) repeat protein
MNTTKKRSGNAEAMTSDAAVESELVRLFGVLHAQRPLRYPELREARRALDGNRPDIAERHIAAFLRKRPGDVDALVLLAEIFTHWERKAEAETLLAQCVEQAPDFRLARFSYANALQQMNKPAAALEQAEILLRTDPSNPLYRDVEAVALSATGRNEEALARRKTIVDDYPGSAKIRVSYAQVLRTNGLQEECIAAFREAIAANPAIGTAWWGLANLRTYKFDEADITQLQAQLVRRDMEPDDRVQMLFTLGKAFGDLGRYRESFDSYARANATRSLSAKYDPASPAAQVAKFKSLFTPEFFAARTGSGADSREPIFVVGMQRAGSTLLEQILSSHSAIEGAGEMAHTRFIARRLEDSLGPKHRTDYPGVLAVIDPAEFRALGEEYLAATLLRRPLRRPFFIDKDPFNFWHVGLYQLMLPRARIIDVRRHPMGCCFSNFTSLFLHGLAHSYRLSDMGRFYANYVEVMAWYDRVLPGRVYRVHYEDLIANPEQQIRQLLDWLELPFESACLDFHANKRAVNSASSEQVRSPLFKDALERWRHYEPWLDPLKQALGPVLELYPAVPVFGAT